MNPLAALQPFAARWQPLAPTGEWCQLCAQVIPDDGHDHLVDLERRALVCACSSCAKLCTRVGGSPAAASARYRVVPNRVFVDPAVRLAEATWVELGIPVGLVFLFHNSGLGRWVALFPSPAGATEAELPEDAFDRLTAATPLARHVQPDVEALLVYARRGAEVCETFLAPIDACYRLVGQVRRLWQGFHGGDRAWQEVDAFFAELRGRARPLEEAR